MEEYLKKEDWQEPQCLLNMDRSNRRFIPQQRVMEKFDAYTHRGDYDGAERHMRYWLAEARDGHDVQGQFMICNELMGLYRKTGQRDKAFDCVRTTLDLIREMRTEDTVGAATAYLNAATVYDAFGQAEKSVPLFERAMRIYERDLAPDDARFGGLYNNMGLALASLGRYGEARACYDKAVAVMRKAPNGALEEAITCLNIADALYAQYGAEDADAHIQALLDEAQSLLEKPELPRGGYYAFVCEKCAPTFTYYGRFSYGAELTERAKRIYAGT